MESENTRRKEMKRIAGRAFPIMQQNHCRITGKGSEEREFSYLTFPGLEEEGTAEHIFTTRVGGVSRGEFSTLNLSFTRGDEEKAVMENYRSVAEAMGWRVEDMVCTDQTHTTNIRLVTKQDRGKGILYPKDYKDIDGFVTNTEGVILAAFFADCVPLFLVDPVHRAIGLAHSGWKGTVGKIGLRMVERMEKEFGSRPKELRAAIGPSICRDCYEVSEDVAEAVRKGLPEWDNHPVLTPGREKGKYQLDLWLANLLLLQSAGIPRSRIEVTDVCTCHNPDYLFSHRASGGRRGNLAAFLRLKES